MDFKINDTVSFYSYFPCRYVSMEKFLDQFTFLTGLPWIHVKYLAQSQAHSQYSINMGHNCHQPYVFSVLRRFWPKLENCPCDTQRGKEVSLPFPGHKRWPPELKWGDLPGWHHSDRDPMPHRGLDSTEFLPGPSEHCQRGQAPEPSILQFGGIWLWVELVSSWQIKLQ